MQQRHTEKGSEKGISKIKDWCQEGENLSTYGAHKTGMTKVANAQGYTLMELEEVNLLSYHSAAGSDGYLTDSTYTDRTSQICPTFLIDLANIFKAAFPQF